MILQFAANPKFHDIPLRHCGAIGADALADSALGECRPFRVPDRGSGNPTPLGGMGLPAARCPQRSQLFDVRENLAADDFLIRLRQTLNLSNGLLQCLRHTRAV